jgi:hypothetical protein
MSDWVNLADLQRKINERVTHSRRHTQLVQLRNGHNKALNPSSQNAQPKKRVNCGARKEPRTSILDLNENVVSVILKHCVDSYKAWWLQTCVVNKQFAASTRAVYRELHASLPSKTTLRDDLNGSCIKSFSHSTRLCRYFLTETYKMNCGRTEYLWLNDMISTMVNNVLTEFEVVDVVSSECIRRLELCSKMMAYEVRDLARPEKELWAFRFTANTSRVLNFPRGGTKFLHIAQALCDGGLAANLSVGVIKSALKCMVQRKGVTPELKDAIISAHVINNLGIPLFN